MQQRQDMMERDFALRAGLAQMEQGSDRTGQVTTMTDPVTGQEFGAYFQNDRQVVPFDVPGAVPARATKVDLGGGAFAYMDGRGRPIPTSAIVEPTVDPVTAQRSAQLRGTVAELEGKVASRGADAKDGANWWPWSETLGARLKGAQAELQSLEKGRGLGTGGQGAAAAAVQASGRFKSAEEVKAAYRAGQVSKEEAARVLRQEFGMQ